MRAVMFRNFKTFPIIEDVPLPEPGPGEVLLKVAGAGAGADAGDRPPGTFPDRSMPCSRRGP